LPAQSTEGGRVYELSEERAKLLVFEALQKDHVILYRTSDPHVLASSRQSTVNGTQRIVFENEEEKPRFVDENQWTVIFKPLGPRATEVFVRRGHATFEPGQYLEGDYAQVPFAVKTQGDRNLLNGEKAFVDRVTPEGLKNFAYLKLTRDPEAETMVSKALEGQADLVVGENGGAPPEAPLGDPAAASQAIDSGLAGLSCDIQLGGLDLVFAPGHLILLADPIGAQEPLRMLRGLACHAAKRHLPLTIAVPIAASKQHSLNMFLASQGSNKDRELFLGSQFWMRDWQDGRSSLAMFEFLEYERTLRSTGAQLTILAAESNRPGNQRQAQVTSVVLKHRLAHEERLFIGLLGNVLVSKKIGAPWDTTLVPLGARLATALPEWTHAFNSGFDGGTHWTCRFGGPGQLACGTWAATPGPSQVSLETGASDFTVFPKTSADGVDGLYRLGTLHVSIPAVERLRVDRGRPELERAAP
jgi:hypothetical protein